MRINAGALGIFLLSAAVAEAQPSTFGIDIGRFHDDEDQRADPAGLARRLKETGVDRVRLGIDLRPRPGEEYSLEKRWSEYDALVGALAGQGISVYALLDAELLPPGNEALDPKRHKVLTDDAPAARRREFISTFSNLAAQVAGRWPGRVTHVEVLNEPNNPGGLVLDGWPAETGWAHPRPYAELLAAVHEAVAGRATVVSAPLMLDDREDPLVTRRGDRVALGLARQVVDWYARVAAASPAGRIAADLIGLHVYVAQTRYYDPPADAPPDPNLWNTRIDAAGRREVFPRVDYVWDSLHTISAELASRFGLKAALSEFGAETNPDLLPGVSDEEAAATRDALLREQFEAIRGDRNVDVALLFNWKSWEGASYGIVDASGEATSTFELLREVNGVAAPPEEAPPIEDGLPLPPEPEVVIARRRAAAPARTAPVRPTEPPAAPRTRGLTGALGDF